jgi:hypothetical protein
MSRSVVESVAEQMILQMASRIETKLGGPPV